MTPFASTLPAECRSRDSGDWRELLDDDTLTAGTMWPISQRFDAAAMYGIYGVTPANIPLNERANWLNQLVKEVVDFAAMANPAGGSRNTPLTRIMHIAQSRHALDNGEGEVDPVSLSILGNVSEGRLRNLMSGNNATLERGPNGGVVAASALSWLQRRTDFMQSIWMRGGDPEASATEGAMDPTFDPDRMLFVPVARDGSTFHPGLRRSGQYQIGAKGEEQYFESFEEALTALNAMPIPHWRRPNDLGHWGIVSGVAWQRLERNSTEG